jgi:cytochrome c551/c552
MTRRGAVAAAGAVMTLVAASIGWQRESVDAVGPRVAAADGATLFRAKGCAACHDGPDSTSTFGFPSLTDARGWAGTRRDGLSAAGYLEESIREPWAYISPAFRPSGGPVEAMPVLGLHDDEVDAIVDYLLGRA